MKSPFVYKLHYCKSDKKSGKPIILRTINLDTNPSIKKSLSQTTENIRSFKYTGYCELEMQFNNADGMANRSGATTILELTPLEDLGMKNTVFIDGVRSVL